jgi:hypothetical protein
METFKRKERAEYANPYLDLMADIDSEIKYFQKRNGLLPNYILINSADHELLANALSAAKMLPSDIHKPTIIQSARLIPSDFMPTGCFDVVGN